MAAFIVATISINDHAGFDAYAKAVAGLRERFGGESLARGPVLDVLEGEAPAGERVVILRFPDTAQARAYFASPEYRRAAALRAGAAKVTLRLLES